MYKRAAEALLLLLVTCFRAHGAAGGPRNAAPDKSMAVDRSSSSADNKRSSADSVPGQPARGRSAKSQESQLLDYLLDDYEPLVRPAMNASATVIVSVGLSLAQLLNVDEKAQVMTTLVWLQQEWYDDRLQWDPAQFNGITRLYVPSSMVWLPDIVLYNTMEITTTSLARSRVALDHTGFLSWRPMVKFDSACRIDITYFPFDDQICWLKMGSWSYDGFQVDVEMLSSVISTDGYAPNDDFDLVNATLTRTVSHYGCCPEPFPDVVAYLHLRRRTLYYVFNILVPCSMLSLISLLSFVLPPNYREQKIMIQLSILLSFSFFKLVIVEVTPRTSDAVPLIGMYLTALMALTAMSTIAHMFAAHLVLAEGIKERLSHACIKVSYRLSAAIKAAALSGRWRSRTGEIRRPAVGCPLAEAEEDGFDDDRASTMGASMDPETSPAGSVKGEADEVGYEARNSAMQYEPQEEQLLQKALHILKSHQQAAADRQQHETRWLWVTGMIDKAFFFTYLLALSAVTLSMFVVKPMNMKLPSS